MDPMNSSRTPIVIRRGAASDARALWRLAALDSAPAPSPGPDVLIAEVEGKLVAAVSRDGAIADPFLATAELVELLRMRVRQVAPAGTDARSPSVRRPRAVRFKRRPLAQA